MLGIYITSDSDLNFLKSKRMKYITEQVRHAAIKAIHYHQNTKSNFTAENSFIPYQNNDYYLLNFQCFVKLKMSA